jgi:hypothetical protein
MTFKINAAIIHDYWSPCVAFKRNKCGENMMLVQQVFGLVQFRNSRFLVVFFISLNV